MKVSVQIKRGSTEDNRNYKGLEGEITVDTDKNCLILHDGKGNQYETVMKKVDEKLKEVTMFYAITQEVDFFYEGHWYYLDSKYKRSIYRSGEGYNPGILWVLKNQNKTVKIRKEEE